MNQFHIFEVLGSGKGSTVYKGRKKNTIIYYAIKSVEKEERARVLQEVRAMHMLRHSNILKFYAWYETRNHLWLILEYCVGGDLMSLLKEDCQLPEHSIHGFARDLANALQHLHAAGMAYCDLKPSNILLDENGRIKLGGFGLSRKISTNAKIGMHNAKRGTPAYMAPELFQAGAPHSSASDLWALGCVLYECAAGRPPFMSSSLTHLVQDILTADPAPIPEASPEFEDLVSRLLDKNPATRIGWAELPRHMFWNTPLPARDMPPEPLLERFIEENGLLPAPINDPLAEEVTDLHAEAPKLCISAVDVMRMSHIARVNLERDSEAAGSSEATAACGDVQLNHHNAELDFREERSPISSTDEEIAPPTPSTSEMAVVMTPPPSSQGRGPMPLLQQSRVSPIRQPNFETATAQPAEPPGRDLQDLSHADTDTTVAGGDADAVVRLEDLIWHPSDSAVIPIVANRRIERIAEPQFDAAALPFPPLSLQDILSLKSQPAQQELIGSIYIALHGPESFNVKVNVLNYLETICCDVSMANIIINAPLTVLLVRLLASARQPPLRVRLASVLGLLVRYCTFINDDVVDTGIVGVLTEALADGNERVQRRMMGTLGELLFYIASQAADRGPGCPWHIPPASLAAAVGLLAPGQDEIAQHYAAKTIENLASQGGEWVDALATGTVAERLAAIWGGARTDALRSCAASALCRLARHSQNRLLPLLASQRSILHLVVGGLNESNTRGAQVPAINLLNLMLATPEVLPTVLAGLQEERGMMAGVLSLLDAVPVLAAKGLVAVALLSRTTYKFLLYAVKSRIVHQMDRLYHEDDPAVMKALTALWQELSACVVSICSSVKDSLQSGLAPLTVRGPAAAFGALVSLLEAPTLRDTLVTDQFILDLAEFVAWITARGPAASRPGPLAEFNAVLLSVLESLVRHSETVVSFAAVMADALLPALAGAVGADVGGDMRFSCLKVLSDITAVLLTAPRLGPGIEERLHGFVSGHMLPLVPMLLHEDEPIPVFALKMIGDCLEAVQDIALPSVRAQGLLPQFFGFLSLDSPHNNVHNLRVCQLLLESRALEPADLQQHGIVQKVQAVVEYAMDNGMETFLPAVLQLLASLLELDRVAITSGWTGAGQTASLASLTPALVNLASASPPSIASVAASCANSLMDMWPAGASA